MYIVQNGAPAKKLAEGNKGLHQLLLDKWRVDEFYDATVLGVMAQRLVRTLCPHCKEHGALDEEAWNLLVAPWKARKPDTVYHARGCLECRMTGFRGRAGIYEMMVLSPNLRRVIQSDCDLLELTEQAARDGMKPLRISGAMKVAAGLTTVEEVLKVAPPQVGEKAGVPRK
jgi:general secretion pathway protein E